MIELLEKNQEKIKEQKKANFVSLLSDTTFKYLFKNEDTREWLVNIIKEAFFLDISNYYLVDNESNTVNKVKDYRMNLKLSDGKNTVIIEMNQDYYDFLESKNHQYLYREAGSMYDTGEKYSGKQTKLLLFNNYRNKALPYLKLGNYVFEDPKTGLRIEDIESLHLYLPNYKKVCYDSSELEVSLSLFSATSFKKIRELTNNPKDIRIIEELERLSMDEEFKLHYNAEAVRKKTENSIKIESFQNGLDKGFSQGIEQEKLEIAKKLLNLGTVSLKDILKTTGLDIDTLKNLK